MQKNYLWTKLKARLLFIHSNSKANYNWIFVPGGPGYGSEYLIGLIKLLCLPGTVWRLDLPGDGSNITANDSGQFAYWPEALTEAVRALDNVILVAHSAGGTFVLAAPALEKLLSGLVLMDTPPDKSWQQVAQEYMKRHPLPKLEEKLKVYTKHPTNKTLQEFVIAAAPYYTTSKGLKKFIAVHKSLPFNYQAFEWSDKKFQPTYESKWVPKKIPTLIFAGDQDYFTPLSLFSRLKKFRRKNILIKEIKNAGHYPWFEKPNEVVDLFNHYIKGLSMSV